VKEMTEQSTSSETVFIYKIMSLLIVIICFGLAVWAYPHLPDKVPSHWNISGEINRYSGRLSGAFLLPSIMLLTLAFRYVVPLIDPKKSNYKLMGKAYWGSIFGVIFFLGVFYFGKIIFSLGMVQFDIVPSIVQVGLGMLLMVIGNYLPKLKHNYLFGIRTPWTLANEEVWYKTHRFMGPVNFIVGIIIVFVGLIANFWSRSALPIVVSLVLILPVCSLVYSYVSFRKLAKV